MDGIVAMLWKGLEAFANEMTDSMSLLRRCNFCLNEVDQLKVLHCGHFACLPCLESWSQEGGTYMCPFCEQQWPVPNGGFDYLPDNLLTRELTKLMHREGFTYATSNNLDLSVLKERLHRQVTSGIRWLNQANWMRALQLSYIFEVRQGYEAMLQKIEDYRDETEQQCKLKVKGLKKRIADEKQEQEEAVKGLQSYIDLREPVHQMIKVLNKDKCANEKLEEAQKLADEFQKVFDLAQSLKNQMNEQSELKAGDSVRLKCKLDKESDTFLRENITHSSVGILHQRLEDGKVLVIYPENHKWKGSVDLLEKSPKASGLPYLGDEVKIWAPDSPLQQNKSHSKENSGTLQSIDVDDEEELRPDELVVYVQFPDGHIWKGLYKELLDPHVWSKAALQGKQLPGNRDLLAITCGAEKDLASKEAPGKRSITPKATKLNGLSADSLPHSAADLKKILQKLYDDGTALEEDASSLQHFVQKRTSRMADFKGKAIRVIRDYENSIKARSQTKIEQEKVGAQLVEHELLEYIKELEGNMGTLGQLTVLANLTFDILVKANSLQATSLLNSVKNLCGLEFWNNHVRRIAYGVDSYWEPKGGDCVRLKSNAFARESMHEYLQGETTLGTIGILMGSYIGNPKAEVLFLGDKAPWFVPVSSFSKILTKRRIPFRGDKVRFRQKAITSQPHSEGSQATYSAVHGTLKEMFPEAKVSFGADLWTGSYKSIELVPGCGFEVGDKVCVRKTIPEPLRGWGGVNKSSVGQVVAIEESEKEERITVDFPECERWVGLTTDLERIIDLREADEVQVKLTVSTPRMGWQSINHHQKGYILYIEGDVCTVGFENNPRFKCYLDEIELCRYTRPQYDQPIVQQQEKVIYTTPEEMRLIYIQNLG